jgi:hypothetical protein
VQQRVNGTHWSRTSDQRILRCIIVVGVFIMSVLFCFFDSPPQQIYDQLNVDAVSGHSVDISNALLNYPVYV